MNLSPTDYNFSKHLATSWVLLLVHPWHPLDVGPDQLKKKSTDLLPQLKPPWLDLNLTKLSFLYRHREILSPRLFNVGPDRLESTLVLLFWSTSPSFDFKVFQK